MTLLNLMLVYCWATLRGALTCWTLLKSPVFLVVFSSSCRSHCRLTGLSAALVQFVCPVDKQGNAAKTDKKPTTTRVSDVMISEGFISLCLYLSFPQRSEVRDRQLTTAGSDSAFTLIRPPRIIEFIWWVFSGVCSLYGGCNQRLFHSC